MILSDQYIKQAINHKEIFISDFDLNNLGSNSYDLHLSQHMAYYKTKHLDMKRHNELQHFDIPDEGFMLEPGHLYLGSTVERTSTHKYVPIIEGKSSVARLGIQVHLTAGFGDVGFDGHWTLEIVVTHPVLVYPNVPICQIYFHTIAGEVDQLYDEKASAKYTHQGARPVGSKMFLNFRK